MDPVRDGIESRLAGVEHTITWLHNIGDGKPRGSVRTTVDRARNGWTSGYFGFAEAQQRYLVDELPTPTRRFASSTLVDPALLNADIADNLTVRSTRP